MGEENVTNEQLVARIQAGLDVPGNMLRLWEQNRGYIALVEKNYQAFEDIEDLKQEGYIGLCRAVDEYKPQEGIAFMTYAGYWIRQQMQRYVENCSSVVRVPSHARAKLRKQEKLVDDYRKEYGYKPVNDQLRRYFGDIQSNTIELARSASTGRIQSLDMSAGEGEDCTVGDLLPGTADVEGDVLDRVEQEELRAVLWGTVDTLPEKQAETIRMRYRQSRTLKQIGEELGCSVEMARTHERKALRELRKPSRAKKLKPFFPEADRQRIYSRAISGTGLTSFEHSWTSATEREALQGL